MNDDNENHDYGTDTETMNLQDASKQASMRFELAGASDLDRYMLGSAAEIRQLLRDISANTELVTLYFDGSGDFLLTSIAGVLESGVILDYGPREDINRRVTTSAKLIFITSRDKIKVQWKSDRAEKVMFDGKLAFRVAIPANVLRLQRREYYRLAAPVANPLACVVRAGTTDKPAKLQFSVADISVGGIAVTGPMQQAGFEIGKTYEDCEIPLPGLGTLITTLSVANIFEVTQKNGHRTLRAGCQFVNMQGKMLTMLQRYINRVERERHERMARFA